MNISYTPATPSAGERPREKALKSGLYSLSDSELLALLIGSGNRTASVFQIAESARSVLEDHAASPDKALPRLQDLRGLGGAKSLMLAAAMELGRRRYASTLRRISSPEDAFDAVKHYGDRSQEHFLTLCLDGAHHLTGVELVTVGLLNRAMVHPREVFAPAIAIRCAAVIIAHNHPSGNLDPSEEDHEVTRRIASAGEILGIQLLDHIIFSRTAWISLRERQGARFTR
jgi:DNA repair protein RadC